ncbi:MULTISPECIES: nucleoside triphosphate pyrophosphatase [unclassified Ruminococcus]|uniref:Maf family protein n=1 Tax=unclassified Ruminococcus TaxID=2608920 RepID=UPI00210E0A43|nr:MULTISPECIES: Maf family protein [unclassified Ruminococcus]MCQ4022602.1 septum formation protein Maf [Ruminococcus sp. zg-924]MCQ4114842.1 septum formation protein Maf [Ruminococcus sp. zg-921]
MIILASASPRRQQLLSLICDSFTVEPANIDECITEDIPLEKTPEYLALKKAEHIHLMHFNDIVIGCDTGVFIGGIMLGKPKTKEEACKTLKMLSGKEHKVITGCSIYYRNEVISFSQTTAVEFFTLSEDEINAYVDTGEPMDKAGAYGIQGKGAALVKSINGDYYNVVGLPVAALKRRIEEII